MTSSGHESPLLAMLYASLRGGWDDRRQSGGSIRELGRARSSAGPLRRESLKLAEPAQHQIELGPAALGPTLTLAVMRK